MYVFVFPNVRTIAIDDKAKTAAAAAAHYTHLLLHSSDTAVLLAEIGRNKFRPIRTEENFMR